MDCISKEEIKRLIDDLESKRTATIEEFDLKNYINNRLKELL